MRIKSVRSGWAVAWMLLALGADLWAGSAMTVRDGSGSSLARLDGDGTVRDRSGSTLGRIEANGTVRDRSGSTLGRVEGDGTVRNRSGSTVGRVDEGGTLRDRGGLTVGRLDGCTVRNASGSTRGRFDGCSRADHHAMAALKEVAGSDLVGQEDAACVDIHVEIPVFVRQVDRWAHG